MRYNNLTVLTIPFTTWTSWPAIHFVDYKGFVDVLFRSRAFVAPSSRFNFAGDKNAETTAGCRVHAKINEGCNFDLLHAVCIGVKSDAGKHVTVCRRKRKRVIKVSNAQPLLVPDVFTLKAFFTSEAVWIDTVSYTACYPSFTIKQCQDLDWISSSRWPRVATPGWVSLPPLWAISPESSRPI